MKKIIEIKAGRNIKLSDYDLFVPDIKHLWTIYNEDAMWGHYKYNPDTGMLVDRNNLDTLKPVHNYGVFLEERLHDWYIDLEENMLHYYSRIVEQGHTVKILIEYEIRMCCDCPNLKPDGGFCVPFCNISGVSKSFESTCDRSEKNIFDHGDVYDKIEKDQKTVNIVDKLVNQLESNRIDINTSCAYCDPTGSLEREYTRANDMLDMCINTVRWYFEETKER